MFTLSQNNLVQYFVFLQRKLHGSLSLLLANISRNRDELILFSLDNFMDECMLLVCNIFAYVLSLYFIYTHSYGWRRSTNIWIWILLTACSNITPSKHEVSGLNNINSELVNPHSLASVHIHFLSFPQVQRVIIFHVDSCIQHCFFFLYALKVLLFFAIVWQRTFITFSVRAGV